VNNIVLLLVEVWRELLFWQKPRYKISIFYPVRVVTYNVIAFVCMTTYFIVKLKVDISEVLCGLIVCTLYDTLKAITLYLRKGHMNIVLLLVELPLLRTA
jgi:hypothetical protein